jgi:hypothetical protein
MDPVPTGRKWPPKNLEKIIVLNPTRLEVNQRQVKCQKILLLIMILKSKKKGLSRTYLFDNTLFFHGHKIGQLGSGSGLNCIN